MEGICSTPIQGKTMALRTSEMFVFLIFRQDIPVHKEKQVGLLSKHNFYCTRNDSYMFRLYICNHHKAEYVVHTVVLYCIVIYCIVAHLYRFLIQGLNIEPDDCYICTAATSSCS